MDSEVSFSKPRERILNEIKDLGFESQNQILLQNSFCKLSQNRKYLIQYQGDVQAIIQTLNEKKNKGGSKIGMDLEGKEEEPYNRHLRNDQHSKIANNVEKQSEEEFIPFEPRKVKEPRKDYSVLTDLNNFNEWPTDIERVYLDGNNMLYVDDNIRKLSIGRSKKKAEKIITELVVNFSREQRVPTVILIFDNTSQTSNQKLQTEQGVVDFSVRSARPSFNDSDDALVDWAGNLNDDVKKSLFVTSDRGLQLRLLEKGVTQIMKPKKWFSFVKAKLGEAVYNEIVEQKL